MIENNTSAARSYRAVIVKRMPAHYSWNLRTDVEPPLDPQSFVGQQIESHQEGWDGALVQVAEVRTGPKWARLMDADGIQHQRVLLRSEYETDGAGTFVPASEHSEFETAMGTWVANLDRAKEQDFFMMWRDGKIANAATVLGAEHVPARFYGSGGLIKPEVRWITSLSIPAWVESLIGQEFDMPHRNPVFYVNLIHDPITGSVQIER